MPYMMQAGIFWFNLMGKQRTILGGKGGEKRRVGVRKWSFPPAGGTGKNGVVK